MMDVCPPCILLGLPGITLGAPCDDLGLFGIIQEPGPDKIVSRDQRYRIAPPVEGR